MQLDSVKKPPPSRRAILAKSLAWVWACSTQHRASTGRFSFGEMQTQDLLCPLCITPRCSALQFHHREDSSLGWSCSHSPSKLLRAGHQEKAIKVTFIPASHHQGFKSKRERMKVSCSLMMHAHSWRGKFIYWIYTKYALVVTACMGCRLWIKLPWLEIKKKRRISAFLFHGNCFSNK